MSKRIAQNANNFTANGIKYLINGEPLSIARFEALERLQLEAEVGGTVKDAFAKIEKALEYLNKMRAVDAGIELRNALLGLSRIVEERHSPLLLICTLFIIKEGENLAEWNESEAIEKIEDWTMEGYAMTDFFGLAVSLLPSFMVNYNENSLNISEDVNENTGTKL